MKILLINNYHYLRGGSEKAYFDTARILERQGNEVAFFSTKNSNNQKSDWSKYFIPDNDLGNKNIPNIILNFPKLFFNFKTKRSLKKLLNDFQPDIVHIHNIYHHILPNILPIIKKEGIPVVMTVHDYKLMCPNYTFFDGEKTCEKCKGGKFYQCAKNKCVKNSLIKSILVTLDSYLTHFRKYFEKNVDCFIVPSKFMEQKMIEHGFDKRKIVYIPNSFDDTVAEKKTSDFSEKYFLYFGRLSREKGIDILIKAVKKIDLGDYKLKIAGEGPEKNSLKKLAEKLEIKNKIEFLGYKSGDELKNLISNSKFTVLPSIWYENAPYSILEAYSLGKTAIGSKMGGISELIKDNETGLLFETGNSKELANKLTDLISNPEKAVTMGIKGRELLKNNLSIPSYYEKLVAGYNELARVDKNGDIC